MHRACWSHSGHFFSPHRNLRELKSLCQLVNMTTESKEKNNLAAALVSASFFKIRWQYGFTLIWDLDSQKELGPPSPARLSCSWIPPQPLGPSPPKTEYCCFLVFQMCYGSFNFTLFKGLIFSILSFTYASFYLKEFRNLFLTSSKRNSIQSSNALYSAFFPQLPIITAMLF